MAELKIVFNGELSVELHDKIVAQALEMLAEVDPAAVAFYDPLPFKVDDAVRVTNKDSDLCGEIGFVEYYDPTEEKQWRVSFLLDLVKHTEVEQNFSADELEKVEADDAEP